MAYPGICVSDQNCWGNPRGQVHQWFYTSDTSWRATAIWGGEFDFTLRRLSWTGSSVAPLSRHVGCPVLTLTLNLDNPEPWDFSQQQAPDIVVINLGTNDFNEANNVTSETYLDAYKKLIQGVHGKYPNAQVVVMVCHCPPFIVFI